MRSKILLLVLAGISWGWALEKELIVPDFSKEAVLDCVAGNRPYRKEGIRLEAERIRNHLVIHNYGHGGSGISLSWGSVEESLEILDREMGEQRKEAVILGAGVIGLTTANQLLKKGWKVRVYASQFPPHTLSNLAPGLWNRVVVDGGKGQEKSERFERILRSSYAHFQKMALETDPEFRGVSPLDIYTFKKRSGFKNMPKGLMEEGISIEATFPDGVEKKGEFYQSFLIDTSIYLADLFHTAKEAGAKFIRRTFQSSEDLSRIPERIIFNCTGYGSKKLFKDNSLIAVRGQLIYLEPKEGFDYMLAGPPKEGLDLYLIPLKDKIVLGGSYEYDVEKGQGDSELCDQILENAQLFFKSN